MNIILPVIQTNSGGLVVDQAEDTKQPPVVRQGMLDELLRGGFVLPPPENSRDGLVIMLCGKAGTGKSTLALQLAANMAVPKEWLNNAPKPERRFFSLEQDGDELKAIYRRMVTNQCRHKWELLRAVRGKDAPTVEVVDEYLNILGADTNEPELRQMAERVLAYGEKNPSLSEKAKDEYGVAELSKAGHELPNSSHALPNDTRIRFDGEDTGDSHLREDPLARAHGFVDKILKVINDEKRDRAKRPILFIDGLSILSLENRGRLELADLIHKLRRCSLLAVIAYEPSRGIEESIDHQVDMAIELEEKHLKTPIDYVLHELHFRKSRYQEAALGWHQYKIRGYGLEIYPSVHFQVHSHLYMASQWEESLGAIGPRRKPRGKDEPRNNEIKTELGWSVIEQVLGGVKPGDSIALLGPRGAFKTTQTLDFLFRSRCDEEQKSDDPMNCKPGPRPRDACSPSLTVEQAKAKPKAQHGLLVSVIDNKDTLRMHEKCPLSCGGRPRCQSFANCCNHVFLFYQRPGAIAPPEFLHYLKTRLQVANPPIRRLAFWDLTQLEYRFPLLANDPMFVPALLDLFKVKLAPPAAAQGKTQQPDRRVKSVFMGAANARLSVTIAAVADNVLFCWRDQVKRGYFDEGQTTSNHKDVKKMITRVWRETGVPDQTRRDYLMIYVDRTSGGFSQEQKNLFAFPILGGSQLFVPSGRWRRNNYAIQSDEVLFFEQAERQILHVTEMQGFSGKVTEEKVAGDGHGKVPPGTNLPGAKPAGRRGGSHGLRHRERRAGLAAKQRVGEVTEGAGLAGHKPLPAGRGRQ